MRKTIVIPARPVNPTVNPNSVTVVTSLLGAEQYFDNEAINTPGVEQTLATYTVPPTSAFYLSKIQINFRHPGCWEMLADNVRIASGNTGASNMESKFLFNPVRPFPVGTLLELKFRSHSSTRPVPIYSHVMGGLQTI